MEYALLYFVGALSGIVIMALAAVSGRASLEEEKLLLELELLKAKNMIAQKEAITSKLKDDVAGLKNQKPLDAKTGFDFNEARETAKRSVAMGIANCTFIRKADAL